MWIQREIVIDPKPRGMHLITERIAQSMPEIQNIRTGLLHLLLQHTSASLTINENADPDVRIDLESSLNRIVPEEESYRHSVEGADDMPAHIKSSLIGCELTIPVGEGRMRLGNWQGIQLGEHRDHPTSRRIIATLYGEQR